MTSSSTAFRALVRRDTYRDSVELMRVAAHLEGLPGVRRAALLMGTPANREIMAAAGLLQGDAAGSGPNDLVVAVAATDDDIAASAIAAAEQLLASQPDGAGAIGASDVPSARTIAEAVAELPAANLAIISTPGPYATAEALKALKRGLNVFLFSDNVSVADEIELKALGRQKDLLVMGPDCGTAILDGVPLGFANVVRRGRIGLVGASGTGLQQVTCLIDRLGEGISQAIGVGGHDLSDAVGGAMMLLAIEKLAADPDTEVLVLVSKPPAESVSQRVLEAAAASGKPVVVNFLGGSLAVARQTGAIAASTLEDAARLAVAVARGSLPVCTGIDAPDAALTTPIDGARASLLPSQRVIRGLYSGGTLCTEAGLILASLLESDEFSVIDLGDDEYTVGRPHPMIDFRLRNEHLIAAAEDPTTAAILIDIVLGYGSHADPADPVRPALDRAWAVAETAGRPLTIIGSVCGTDADPQGLARQEAALRAAGVLLAPSNAQAARLAARVIRQPEEGSVASMAGGERSTGDGAEVH
jgi:FdrA protein